MQNTRIKFSNVEEEVGKKRSGYDIYIYIYIVLKIKRVCEYCRRSY
jgi:hypothetical protein